jgi:hypothetical protein
MKLPALAGAALFCALSVLAHPLDQDLVRTDSRFSILKKSVRFEIKFPAHPFFDSLSGRPKEVQPAVDAYLRDHLLVFDGREPLSGAEGRLHLQRVLQGGPRASRRRRGDRVAGKDLRLPVQAESLFPVGGGGMRRRLLALLFCALCAGAASAGEAVNPALQPEGV